VIFAGIDNSPRSGLSRSTAHEDTRAVAEAFAG